MKQSPRNKSFIWTMRPWIMWAATLTVVGWYWLTDPDGGAETLARLQHLVWIVVVAGPVYLLRRALMDGARSRAAFDRAMETPLGAAVAFTGLCLLTGLLFIAVSGRAQAAEPPPRAQSYLPLLHAEIASRWPDHPAASVLGALIEQETCPSLASPKCWNPGTELKTSREYGFGLGQHTVAYRADGSERFNTWRELRTAHANHLNDWHWQNRYDARLQLRAVVLQNRDCYRRLARLIGATENTLAMCDAGYNGGVAGVLAERRLCAAVKGCDPDQWFGHVERHSSKSREKWRGYGASAFEINRTHVHNVMVTRRPRYLALEKPHA